MVTINIVYEGDLRCKALHEPSQKTLETDAPIDNHGKGENFSPTDLLATSLGVCNLTIMGIVAEREKIDLKGTKVKVEKYMTSTLPRKVEKLIVVCKFKNNIPEKKRDFLERAAKDCPVARSLHPDIIIEYSFNYE